MEAGADPNVLSESDFGVRHGLHRGEAVTHMATSTAFGEYFDLVFQHGGDPNLIDNGVTGIANDAALSLLVRSPASDKLRKARVLIAAGADLNHVNGSGFTPAMEAVGFLQQFDLALLMLDSGADPDITAANTNKRLVHLVLQQGDRRGEFRDGESSVRSIG